MAEIVRCASCSHECDRVYRRAAILELFGGTKDRQLLAFRLVGIVGCALDHEAIDKNIEDIKTGEAEIYVR